MRQDTIDELVDELADLKDFAAMDYGVGSRQETAFEIAVELITRLTAELEKTEQALDRASNREAEANDKVRSLTAENERLQAEAFDALCAYNELAAEKSRLRAENERLEAQLNRYKDEVEEAGKAVLKIHRENERMKNSVENILVIARQGGHNAQSDYYYRLCEMIKQHAKEALK